MSEDSVLKISIMMIMILIHTSLFLSALHTLPVVRKKKCFWKPNQRVYFEIILRIIAPTFY